MTRAAPDTHSVLAIFCPEIMGLEVVVFGSGGTTDTHSVLAIFCPEILGLEVVMFGSGGSTDTHSVLAIACPEIMGLEMVVFGSGGSTDTHSVPAISFTETLGMNMVAFGSDGSSDTFSVPATGFTDIDRAVTVFGSKFVAILAFATPTAAPVHTMASLLAAAQGRRASWRAASRRSVPREPREVLPSQAMAARSSLSASGALLWAARAAVWHGARHIILLGGT